MGWGRAQPLQPDPAPLPQPVALSPLVRPTASAASSATAACGSARRCPRTSSSSSSTVAPTATSGPSTSTCTSPFHGNITELCPVGALTSEAYRFRARPWDIEDSGSICLLCPSQCNVKFTVRDEQVERVPARDNHAVDDGWSRQGPVRLPDDRLRGAGHRARVGGSRPAGTRLDAIAERLRAAGSHAAAIVGGRASNEEGYLAQRIIREALGRECHLRRRARRPAPCAAYPRQGWAPPSPISTAPSRS